MDRLGDHAARQPGAEAGERDAGAAEPGRLPGDPRRGLHGPGQTYPLLDWGPQYKAQDETGIATQQPPAYLGRDYAILVPQVDADGNDIAGIRSVDVAAGLGTNTGWNYTNSWA